MSAQKITQAMSLLSEALEKGEETNTTATIKEVNLLAATKMNEMESLTSFVGRIKYLQERLDLSEEMGRLALITGLSGYHLDKIEHLPAQTSASSIVDFFKKEDMNQNSIGLKNMCYYCSGYDHESHECQYHELD